jgi:hypothetical protein
MSALGQKRPLHHVCPMSALPQKADIGERDWNLRSYRLRTVGFPSRSARKMAFPTDGDSCLSPSSPWSHQVSSRGHFFGSVTCADLLGLIAAPGAGMAVATLTRLLRLGFLLSAHVVA